MCVCVCVGGQSISLDGEYWKLPLKLTWMDYILSGHSHSCLLFLPFVDSVQSEKPLHLILVHGTEKFQ